MIKITAFWINTGHRNEFSPALDFSTEKEMNEFKKHLKRLFKIDNKKRKMYFEYLLNNN